MKKSGNLTISQPAIFWSFDWCSGKFQRFVDPIEAESQVRCIVDIQGHLFDRFAAENVINLTNSTIKAPSKNIMNKNSSWSNSANKLLHFKSLSLVRDVDES